MSMGLIQQSLGRTADAYKDGLNASAVNQSNVLNESHHRERVVYHTEVTQGQVSGLSTTTERVFNEEMQNALFVTDGLEAKANTLAKLHEQFQKNFGSFGSTTTSSNRLATLFTRMDALSKTPLNPQLSSLVLDSAQSFTDEVNKLTNAIQTFRMDADANIEIKVKEANSYIQQLKDLNYAIGQALGRSGNADGLKDQRYGIMEKLSRIIPLKCSENPTDGNAYIQTIQGFPLVNGPEAVTISFTKSQNMSPALTYSNGDLNGIINVGETDPALKDITRRLGGGELAALFQARDTDFPSLQAEFDEWVSSLTTQFNAVSSEGTGYPVPTQLQGTRLFAGDTDVLNATGTLRVAITDRTTGVITANDDIDLSTVTTIGALNAKFAALGITVSYSKATEGYLILDSGDANKGISMVSLTPTQETTTGLGLPHYLGINTLFHNSTPVKTGCANTVTVNPTWRQNPTLVPKGTLTKEAITLNTTLGLYSGDASTATALTDLSKKKISFSGAGTLTAVTTTLTSYASSILSAEAFRSNTAKEEATTAAQQRKAAFDDYQSFKGVTLEKEIMGASQIVASMEITYAMSSLVRQAQRTWLDSIR